MRNPVTVALVAVIVLLVAGAALLFVKNRNDYASLKVEEEASRNRYAETIDAIAEIQDSLSAISLGDTSVQMRSQGYKDEQQLAEPSGREALDRISVLRASIMRNKERIRGLEANLKSSGMKVSGLQKMIAGLKRTVAEKESEIGMLAGRVDSLQTEVVGLSTAVQQTQDTLRVREEAIENKRRELATVYYIIGTRKDLTDSGVIVAKGGLLGLGRTLQPTGQVDESRFTALDTDQDVVVNIPSAKVKVLSAQPASSYQLTLAGDKTELRIIDPREFRTVKHLVILTS